jgi:8-oxo-dGTP pyrophosphatase MutT (NUDIX family)
VEVLLVTTRGQGRWIVPKGNVEPDLGPRRSAEREAFEEAGVTGPIGQAPFGHYHHGRSKRGPGVAVFLLRVEEEAAEYPERGLRRRRWVPVEDAARRVGVQGLRDLLGAAAAVLQPARAGRRFWLPSALAASPWPLPPWGETGGV